MKIKELPRLKGVLEDEAWPIDPAYPNPRDHNTVLDTFLCFHGKKHRGYMVSVDSVHNLNRFQVSTAYVLVALDLNSSVDKEANNQNAFHPEVQRLQGEISFLKEALKLALLCKEESPKKDVKNDSVHQ